MKAGEVLARMVALPVAPLDSILPPGPALVLAPHPDDETLGCGGLIAAACAQGRAVHVLVLTDGTGSHAASRAYPAPRLAALRAAELREAVSRLGLPEDRLALLGLRDTQAPHDGPDFADAVARVVAHGAARGVTSLLATWEHDPHADHVATWRIAAAAAARLGARLLAYPVWGWTLPPEHELPDAPVAGARLDIAPQLAAKRHAIAAHRSQTTDLITDDPNGFRLPDRFLALFTRPFEVFLHG